MVIVEASTIGSLDTEQPAVRPWTAQEIYYLTRYYGRVPCRSIVAHLPGRTMKAVQCKAYNLGLTVHRESSAQENIKNDTEAPYENDG